MLVEGGLQEQSESTGDESEAVDGIYLDDGHVVASGTAQGSRPVHSAPYGLACISRFNVFLMAWPRP